jgi:CO/xanthine dehydrogenase Mo-binding subunit
MNLLHFLGQEYGSSAGGLMKNPEDDMPEELQVVGHPVVRVDARAKLSGEAKYSADFLEVKALQGKILRSPYAHAEILRIDTAKAGALPGVHAIVTFHDAPGVPFEGGEDSLPDPVAPVYVLNSVVRHVGDEVAAVAADTLEIAEEALDRIEIEYKQLPFVLDAEAAVASGAPIVRGGGTNVAGREPISFERGDAENGMTQADFVMEGTYRTQSTSPLSLEPRYCVAQWQGERLRVWKSSRHVHGDRNRLAKVFGVPHENVRVAGMYMGAGFGSKDESRLGVITALVARKARHAVRIGYTREEELAFGKWRHATVTRVKLGMKRDGSISAIDAHSVLNTGPYAPGFGVAQRLGHGLTYLYKSANARFEGKVAFTNAPVAGSYRGLGAPQAHFALESLADEVAEHLGMDPLEFRKRNHVRPEGQPGSRRTPPDEIVPAQPIEGGIAFSSNYLAECLEEGAKRIGWKPRPKGPRKLRVNGKFRGMGMAACIYKTGQNSSSAIVKVKPDGTAELLMSTMEIGQGAWTILTQIAAETVGIKFENVKGIFADTGEARRLSLPDWRRCRRDRTPSGRFSKPPHVCSRRG